MILPGGGASGVLEPPSLCLYAPFPLPHQADLASQDALLSSFSPPAAAAARYCLLLWYLLLELATLAVAALTELQAAAATQLPLPLQALPCPCRQHMEVGCAR